MRKFFRTFSIHTKMMDPKKEEFEAQLISLEEAYEAALKLHEKIHGAALDFDLVVAIARGGFPPARFLCDFLNIKQLFSIQIKHYGGGAEQQENAEVLNSNTGPIENKKVLLVDDVNDTGKSLETAFRELEKSRPLLLKTAVLHEKENTEFKADFVGESFRKWKWLIYQWAASEDIIEFLKKGDMLTANPLSAGEFLEKEYNLRLDKQLLEKIMGLKSNYQKNSGS